MDIFSENTWAYITSCAIFTAYLAYRGATFSFGWVVYICLYSLWLTAPAVFYRGAEKWIALFVWIAIQLVIHYYRITPPQGVGVPYN